VDGRSSPSSRFAPEEWLQPCTGMTIERLAGEEVKRIAVVSRLYRSMQIA
jgi:protoheme ferro-lyase